MNKDLSTIKLFYCLNQTSQNARMIMMGYYIIKALRCLVWVSLGDTVPQAPWDLSLTCQSRRVKIGRKAA